MLEKQALQTQIAQVSAIAPVRFPAGVDDWQRWRFRQVIVTGEFIAERQILIDNRIHAGYAGFDVVAPLALDDGRIVLVDRGWTPLGATRARLPDVPAPRGSVTVRGRIDIPASRYFEIGNREPPDGALWQHLDPARFAAATGLAVLPIVVEALDTPGRDALVRDWPPPDAGIEKHLGYMVQWYAFAAMAAGLWLWFTFAPRRRMAERARDAAMRTGE